MTQLGTSGQRTLQAATRTSTLTHAGKNKFITNIKIYKLSLGLLELFGESSDESVGPTTSSDDSVGPMMSSEESSVAESCNELGFGGLPTCENLDNETWNQKNRHKKVSIKVATLLWRVRG